MISHFFLLTLLIELDGLLLSFEDAALLLEVGYNRIPKRLITVLIENLWFLENDLDGVFGA